MTKDLGGRFKVMDDSLSVVEGRKIFFLYAGLKGSQFSEDNLKKVARRIRETYCAEPVINAVIIDKSDRRRFDDLTPPPIFPPSTRALYSLDRTRGEEKLQFYRNEKYGAEIKLN